MSPEDMESFTLTLANGATLTGLSNLPAHTPTAARYRPLMVGLHGGTYDSRYFDVNDKATAALASNGLGVPWIAIDRPGYGTSTSFGPIPEGSSYAEMDGEWLHKFILPAVWQEYGVPQGCNAIVLLSHSLGSTGAVIAAVLYAAETEAGGKPSYPLAGVIVSGFGTMGVPEHVLKAPEGEPEPEALGIPPEAKDQMLLPQGLCDPSVHEHTARLNGTVPLREVQDIGRVWAVRFKTDWAPRVRVPVMIGLAEKDYFWQGTEEHARDLAECFSGSPRVDAGVIRGASHNLEMSYWSHGWYARCFGFGLECAASFALA